jgi:tagatose 6-phosphate kinase
VILTITANPSLDRVYAIDDFQVNKIFRPKAMTATAGGKGLNVSRVASILGAAVTATGFIGGTVGSLVSADMQLHRIVDRFVRISGATRMCITVMDEKNTTSTEILESGPVITADEMEVFLRTYDELLDACETVVGSGSLPRGLPADFYAELIRRAKARQRRFILDTSGAHFTQGMKETPYMVKPNQEELEAVVGSDLFELKDCVGAVMALKENGIELPVLTLGKRGCLAALSDGVYHFSAPPIPVVNTVGSGDSFVAGVAVALCQGRDEHEALRLGMACGMANTQFMETGMVSADLVRKFLPSVTARRLAACG